MGLFVEPAISADTFTPIVTLVGGVGNTVPVYTTNTGRYIQIINRVFVDVYLTGDGGAEGAGTGQMNIDLPIAASADNPAGITVCGLAVNGTDDFALFGEITASATTITLNRYTVLNDLVIFQGADQNNVTRTIRLKFHYEI